MGGGGKEDGGRQELGEGYRVSGRTDDEETLVNSIS